MSDPKTIEQIKQARDAVKEEAETLPDFSMFGDDNREGKMLSADIAKALTLLLNTREKGEIDVDHGGRSLQEMEMFMNIEAWANGEPYSITEADGGEVLISDYI